MARNNPQYKNAFSLNPDSFKENAQDAQEVCTTSTISTRGETQEVQEVEFGATQGKKGQKAPRINMAFSPDVHRWIKTYSRQQGQTATELVNNIFKTITSQSGKVLK